MKKFTAFMQTSANERTFIGQSWEEGGFNTNDDGEPITDVRGNRVSKFSVSDITADDADLLRLAYAGDDYIDGGNLFAGFLAGECDLDDATIDAVCLALGVEYSKAELAEYRRILALPASERIAAMAMHLADSDEVHDDDL